MVNRVTKKERDTIDTRAEHLLAQADGHNCPRPMAVANAITKKLRQEYDISRDRARRSAARAFRVARGRERRARQ